MAHDVKMHKVKARDFEQEMKDEGFGENQKHQPSVTFDFHVLPDGKKWQNGERYRVVIEGKQVGSHNKNGNGHVEIAIEQIGGELITKKRVLRKPKNA